MKIKNINFIYNMLSFLRIARFAGSHHPKPAATEAHNIDSHADDHHVHSESCSHGAHGDHAADHHDHGDHGDHGHISHTHKKIPEGSWHRHSDDEDPFYYYNRYGPFHSFSTLYFNMPDHPGGSPEDDIYRHVKQGYIRLVDPDDNRRNVYRGFIEALIVSTLLFLGIGIATKRNDMDDDMVEKKIGDALITAQEIEIFIKEAKKKL